MSKVLLVALVIAVLGCGNSQQKNEVVRLSGNQAELKTFPVAGGWGYSIDVNGSKFIRQENIPVLPGSHPFATSAQAEKVGTWVANRIRHNESFSLTLSQLQSLMGTNAASN